MDRLIYTALSGMRSSMSQQKVIANNMANSQTPGFREELLDWRPITLKGESLEVRAMQQGEVRAAMMHAGEMIEAQRLFAMRSKMISTAGDVDESGAQLMRLR